ncbi:MAG: alpha-1,4-glucan--maltose-1-phosphate maltosyltransferase [Polyangiaceae bacterium]|nr:alpha-1,4-glucan--maltose-1-phosphate maltosyltransferase [Polyangiaceae bacterium]
MVSVSVPPPRVVIEGVTPQLEGGRYAVKRCVGETVVIGADIFKDGHDHVAARTVYRHAQDRRWREAPLTHEYGPDRWTGSFVVDAPGRWQFAVEAWPDRFRTWREHLEKYRAAGQDVAVELLEGATLLERCLDRMPKQVRIYLRSAARQLADVALPLSERVDLALSAELAERVWGPLLAGDATRSAVTYEVFADRSRAVFSSWYELFPRSQAKHPGVHGTFRDAQDRLPDIAQMGFDVVYLPPIHPIGKVHRKGRNNTPVCEADDVGSPWAIGSEDGGHDAIHPQLGTLPEFHAFVRSAADLGIEIALDFALQCAPDHPWVTAHPDWFFVRADGSIRYAENPPKRYEDIYPLNFWCENREALWTACRDLLLYWVDQGVRTFRVDNPHTKPLAFWEWVIREVQRDHPDVIFFAEAFTRPKRMYGLAKLGFTMSYSYFTWKNTKWELEEFLRDLGRPEVNQFYRPNFFANTPDILHEYLQRGGRPAFRVRLLLAGTLSPLYGIYSGYELCENTPLRPGSEEYLDSEKYEIRVRDWDQPGNIKSDVKTLNRIRRENPALQSFQNLRLVPTNSEHLLAYWKHAPGNDLIVVVNLDPHGAHDAMVEVAPGDLGIGDSQSYEVEDLLDGRRYTWRGARNFVRLDPTERVGHVLRVRRQR